MRRSAKLFTMLGVFSLLAFAESWQGKLVDNTCYEQKKTVATCDATGTTTMFALFSSNKAYKLDEAGNAKAAVAIKSRADRASDPAKAPSPEVAVKITGTKDAQDVLKVETIEIQ